MLLLAIVLLSASIPFIQLPLPMQSTVRVELPSVFMPVDVESEAIAPANSRFTESGSTEMPSTPTSVKSHAGPSTPQLLFYGYLAGCLIAFLILVRGLVWVLFLTRKARSIRMEGFRLLVVEGEIPAFSFGRWVVLSQSDYAQHRLPLLAHEQAHIRLYHFYDLLLLEFAKIIYWFNPVIYWMAKDLKEIHEFQADDYTLTNGIDATQYQLLIIQKGVGAQRFALANSFNHCQIKKRITMMNKPKHSKAWSWKVATFLPLLALLLMAFGRQAESGPPSNSALSSVEQVLSRDSTRQWSESDFLSLDGLNLLIKMGKTPNWKDPEFASFEKNGKWVTVKKDYFNGFVHCEVQIDSRSQLRIGNRTKLLDWNEFRDSIRTYVDYEVANNLARPFFHPAMTNGVIRMSPQCYFFILSDKSTPIEDYQRFLNTIGNTIYEIRGKYSLEIYNKEYSELNSEQREQIDIMVPLMARFLKTPQLRVEKKIAKDSISVGSKQSEKIELVHADTYVPNSKNPSIMYFYNAQVKFNEWNLTADYIEVNKDSSLIYATGRPDSTGEIVRNPILIMDNQKITASEIRFNYKTKKGIFKDIKSNTKF
jgi:hypothetical protein